MLLLQVSTEMSIGIIPCLSEDSCFGAWMVLMVRVDLETAQVDVLGSHDNGVRSVIYSSATGIHRQELDS